MKNYFEFKNDENKVIPELERQNNKLKKKHKLKKNDKK